MCVYVCVGLCVWCVGILGVVCRVWEKDHVCVCVWRGSLITSCTHYTASLIELQCYEMY